MRYMGLDLGNRTVGIAFSDPMGIVATGYETYRFNEKDLQNVLEYVKILVVEKNVDKCVMCSRNCCIIFSVEIIFGGGYFLPTTIL